MSELNRKAQLRAREMGAAHAAPPKKPHQGKRNKKMSTSQGSTQKCPGEPLQVDHDTVQPSLQHEQNRITEDAPDRNIIEVPPNVSSLHNPDRERIRVSLYAGDKPLLMKSVVICSIRD